MFVSPDYNGFMKALLILLLFLPLEQIRVPDQGINDLDAAGIQNGHDLLGLVILPDDPVLMINISSRLDVFLFAALSDDA